MLCIVFNYNCNKYKLQVNQEGTNLLALDSKLLSCRLRDNALAFSCKPFLSLAISAI